MDQTPDSPPSKPYTPEPRQAEIRSLLLELVSSGAADFYEDACKMMFSHKNNQNPPASITNLVGHSLREVESSLRSVLKPFDEREIRTCEGCEREVNIEAKYCVSCGRVKEDGNSQKNQIEAILNGLGIGMEDEIAKAWVDISGANRYAHRPGLKPLRKINEDFIDVWNKTELVLYGVLHKVQNEYHKVFAAIDKIAAIDKPKKSDANYLSQNITPNQVIYEYLFNKLESPDWLPLLRKRDFFEELPAPEYGEHEGSPTLRYPPWPAAIYLKKVASASPKEVAEILLALPDTENQTVKMSLLEIVALLPNKQYVLLAEKVKKWTTPTGNYYFLGKETDTNIEKLISAGNIDIAVEISRDLLSVLPDPKSKTIPTTLEEKLLATYKPITKLDDWNYGNFLENGFKKVAEASPNKALTVVCESLEKFLEYKRVDRESDKDFEDYMYISHPFIEEGHEKHVYDRTEHSLVNAVRDTALQILAKDTSLLPEIVKQLESYKWKVFERLAMYLISEFPDVDKDLTAKYITNPIYFDSSSVKHEYHRLLDKGFSLIKPEDQSKIFKRIKEKRPIRKYIKKAGSDPELAKKQEDYWEYEQLSGLKNHLKGKRKERYEELVKLCNETEVTTSLMKTVTSPQSVISAKSISEMDKDSLIDLLKTWNPKKEDAGYFRTKEAVGRELSIAIKNQPELFSKLALKFKGLDPTYVRSYLQAFNELIQTEYEVDWEQIITLSEWVLTQPVEIPGRTGHPFDQDPDWNWTRKAIASIISRGLNGNQIPYHLRKRVWGIIESLSGDSNPTPEEELDRSGKPILDAYSLSINTTRGDAMSAVLEYALWVLREERKIENIDGSVSSNFSNMSEVKVVLEKHLDHKQDPSVAVRAVYGRFLPWLLLLDKDWTIENLEKIFPKEDFRNRLYQAAWNTYISYVPAYNEPFKVLGDQYLLAVKSLTAKPKEDDSRLNPEQRLAEHLMIFYGRGLVELDDELMVLFWNNAPDNIRAHALDFVGRGLLEEGLKLSENHTERLKALWEKRRSAMEESENKEKYKGEMAAFGWWFASDVLDENWATEEYLKALNISGQVHSDYYVVRRLTKIAESLPFQALQVLEKLVNAQERSWLVSGNEEEIKKVLQLGLIAPESKANELAKHIISALLLKGYSGFGDLLKALAAKQRGSKDV